MANSPAINSAVREGQEEGRRGRKNAMKRARRENGNVKRLFFLSLSATFRLQLTCVHVNDKRTSDLINHARRRVASFWFPGERSNWTALSYEQSFVSHFQFLRTLDEI